MKTNRHTKRGQSLVEYALVIAFISVAAISALMAMSKQISSMFGTVNVQLTSAERGGSPAGGR